MSASIRKIKRRQRAPKVVLRMSLLHLDLAFERLTRSFEAGVLAMEVAITTLQRFTVLGGPATLRWEPGPSRWSPSNTVYDECEAAEAAKNSN